MVIFLLLRRNGRGLLRIEKEELPPLQQRSHFQIQNASMFGRCSVIYASLSGMSGLGLFCFGLVGSYLLGHDFCKRSDAVSSGSSTYSSGCFVGTDAKAPLQCSIIQTTEKNRYFRNFEICRIALVWFDDRELLRFPRLFVRRDLGLPCNRPTARDRYSTELVVNSMGGRIEILTRAVGRHDHVDLPHAPHEASMSGLGRASSAVLDTPFDPPF